MTRLFVILLAASFALTAIAAVAENTVSESRTGLAAAWEQARAGAAARIAAQAMVRPSRSTRYRTIREREPSGH